MLELLRIKFADWWFARQQRRQISRLAQRYLQATGHNVPASAAGYEPGSPTAHFVRQWATERLALARATNDLDLDSVQTAKLRGRIEVLKEVQALGQPQAPAEPQPTDLWEVGSDLR